MCFLKKRKLNADKISVESCFFEKKKFLSLFKFSSISLRENIERNFWSVGIFEFFYEDIPISSKPCSPLYKANSLSFFIELVFKVNKASIVYAGEFFLGFLEKCYLRRTEFIFMKRMPNGYVVEKMFHDVFMLFSKFNIGF